MCIEENLSNVYSMKFTTCHALDDKKCPAILNATAHQLIYEL